MGETDKKRNRWIERVTDGEGDDEKQAEREMMRNKQRGR